MKIAFFEIEPREQELLTTLLGQNHQLTFHAEALTAENAELAGDSEVVSVFIYSKLDAATIEKLPQLKLITTRSMGFDHIDQAAAAARQITVCNVPSYGERTVAEHAFALILALSRNLMAAYERTEKSNFDYHGLTGIDLQGKTIGIIGGGRIGLNVARIAKNGFEMNVIVSDPRPNPELAAQIGFSYVSVEELLQKSDVISLHAPYMPATHHLINENNITLIKKGAILINTARGALIDTKALLMALEKGIVAGAGLDVLEEECAIKEETELMSKNLPAHCDLNTILRNHLLIARNDVIITPHIAFNSKEALDKILHTTADNIISFASGQPINLLPVRK